MWPVGEGSGCFSSSDPTLHVGPGPAGVVDGFEVLWPSGLREAFPGARAGERVVLEEGGGARPGAGADPAGSGGR